MKVMLLGANGQLGSDIADTLKVDHQVIALTHSDLDVTDAKRLDELLTEHKPDVLINTTAYHQVELCEQNPETAYAINAIAPAEMATQCRERGIRFMHFSTDYVFDGNTAIPYLETDIPKPLNVYGASKWKGEQDVLNANPDAMVIRVSGLYGSHPCRAKNGLNFVQTMLKLARERGSVKVVADEFVSPTYTRNIAQQVYALLDSNVKGIIHATSTGYCSWYEFAREIFDYTKTPVELSKANSDDFPAKVPRPKYSVLENHVLDAHLLNRMEHWKVALHQYLDEIKE
ncbi:MAG: dTDP-4-dehydrorhamnose reductase [Bacteroidia bacterium]|jgi:dTDP-4-dehydrorhamnose reductase